MSSVRQRLPEDGDVPLLEQELGDEKGHKKPPRGPSLVGERANIALLLFLYALQGVPLGLAAAVPMVLQNKGVQYKDQAMFSLVNWPFSLKLLWAPIVDSVFCQAFGRRKTWLVPTQYLIGLFMVILSYRVDHWMTDPQGPHTVLLTALFFMLNFLAATQDIAVDGWAITMLRRENVGYASTCNSVGQTTGYFLGYVMFMALESATFCNGYLRSNPQPVGIITLPSFLFLWGLVFMVTTTVVGLAKTEAPPDIDDEPSLNIVSTYKQLLRIIRLPAVRTLALAMLTCKVGFSGCDAVSGLKLIEAGVPRERFAMLALFLMPLQISLPLLLSKYLVSRFPMDVFIKAYPYRLGFNFVAAGLVWITPHLISKDHIPTYYYCLLLVLYSLHQVALYSMFVTQMAFFARVSDPSMGGTYMTLLNTVSNLAITWPNSLVLLFVDGLTYKSCSTDGYNNCSTPQLIEHCGAGQGKCETWLDGYYPLTALCTLLGLLWLGWGRRTIRAVQRLEMRDWKVTHRTR